MKKVFFLLLVFIALQKINAQHTDSCRTRISLLTCTPGEALYSTFGHSALRVVDSSSGTDVIFNYGTFDFDDPEFYQKFTKGSLQYFVSTESPENFLSEYKYFKRGVTEQVLSLSCQEKEQFISALYENAKEENKYYRYDFNYDNCTTRLRDMLEKATGQPLQTANILPAPHTTFRDMIHEYLDRGYHDWSKLGIDILLGSPLDKRVTNREAMFLPDYLMMAFDSASLRGQLLVIEKNEILPVAAPEKTKPFFTPFVAFAILWVIIVVMTLIKTPLTHSFFRVFDPLFFTFCGLLGAFLLFMWFGTEHAMAKYNFNLLWALPTHLVAGPLLFSRKRWVKKYFYFTCLYYLGLLAAWFFLPQEMNAALLPVVAVMLVRSAVISKRN